MAIDVEALLTPISEEAPAGPERLKTSSRALIERYFNDAIEFEDSAGKKVTNREGAADPDAVKAAILSEFDETLDLGLAVALAQIGARTGNLDVAAAGVEVTAGLLERYWDSVHPALEIAEVIGRRNLCNTLGDHAEFVRPLRGVAVLRHPRMPEVSLGQLADLAQDEGAGDAEIIRLTVYGDPDRNLTGLGPEALSAAQEDLARVDKGLARIEAVFANHGGAPNFDRLRPLLAGAKAGLARFLPETTAPPGAGGEGAAADSAVAGPAEAGDRAASAAQPGSGAPGRIESRDDVVKALDAICAYYARKEPGSPVPLALRRARGWVFMNFIDVLKDIAPGSMSEAARVFGESAE